MSVQKILGGKRISIPEEAAKFLHLKIGDYVLVTFNREKRTIIIVPAKVVPR